MGDGTTPWAFGWTAIGIFVFVVGIGIAIWQIIEARRGRNAQLVAQLYQSLRTEKSKRILRKIYYADPSKVKATVRKEEIERVLDDISLIGLLVHRHIFDNTLAIRVFMPWGIRCWYKLNEYIKKIREERGQYYAKNLEDFAKRCVKYQIEHDPKEQWVCLTINGTHKNLVEELKDTLLTEREFRIVKLKRTLRSIWKSSLREKI
jgi:ribosomal protein S6